MRQLSESSVTGTKIYKSNSILSKVRSSVMILMSMIYDMKYIWSWYMLNEFMQCVSLRMYDAFWLACINYETIKPVLKLN